MSFAGVLFFLRLEVVYFFDTGLDLFNLSENIALNGAWCLGEIIVFVPFSQASNAFDGAACLAELVSVS